MAVSEAEKRAKSKYAKKVKQVVIRFYPGEEDDEMYGWIKSHENVTGYMKELVRADMESAFAD